MLNCFGSAERFRCGGGVNDRLRFSDLELEKPPPTLEGLRDVPLLGFL